MPPAPTPEASLPTVQLRHELPDGSWHVDWMLGRDAGGRERLLTFRLPCPLAALVPGEGADAEHIGDHRPAYLDYQGPLSGDRGHVVRIDRGRIIEWRGEDEDWAVTVEWESGTGPVRYRAWRESGARWIVTRLGGSGRSEGH